MIIHLPIARERRTVVTLNKMFYDAKNGSVLFLRQALKPISVFQMAGSVPLTYNTDSRPLIFRCVIHYLPINPVVI